MSTFSSATHSSQPHNSLLPYYSFPSLYGSSKSTILLNLETHQAAQNPEILSLATLFPTSTVSAPGLSTRQDFPHGLVRSPEVKVGYQEPRSTGNIRLQPTVSHKNS